MMFVGLPDGFTVEKEKSGHLMGQTWNVGVYYNKRPAFEMTKDFDVDKDRERYLARSIKYIRSIVHVLEEGAGDWQEFSSLGEMVLVMCTRHRMGVK